MATRAGSARQISQPRKIPEQSQTDILTLEERIRLRACRVWLEYGGRSGSAPADWLRTKEEIRRDTEP